MTTSARALATLVTALSLTGCGGWWDDDEDAQAAAGGAAAAAVTLTCNTAGYAAGSVELPSAAQLAAYAGTYEGDEGRYGPNPGDGFVKAASATLVFGADGSLSYKGAAYAVTSACIDKASGALGKVLYLVGGKGHLDIADKVDPTLGSAWGVALSDGTTIFTKGLKR
jgi:hypothetical protein